MRNETIAIAHRGAMSTPSLPEASFAADTLADKVVDDLRSIALMLDDAHDGLFDEFEQTFTFDTDETTVAMVAQPDHGVVRIYADIGMPEPSERSRIFEAALRGNLTRGELRHAVGMHASSGRLVITSALKAVEGADPRPLAQRHLNEMLECVRAMRSAYTFS